MHMHPFFIAVFLNHNKYYQAVKYIRVIKMSEKARELWQITLVVAINLALLIIIIFSSRADAVCLGQSGEKVAAVQRSLLQKNFYSGEINGEYNFGTRNAVKKYQRLFGVEDTGEADFETLRLLGLDAKSGECFSVETEILARYLKLCGGSTYPEMLSSAKNILYEAENSSLSHIIFSDNSISYKSLISSEASSDSFSAALYAIKNYK